MFVCVVSFLIHTPKIHNMNESILEKVKYEMMGF